MTACIYDHHLPVRYQIIEELGQGGMSVVFKARDLILDRLVAIKALNTPKIDSRMVVRFHNEAKAIARLNHPSIVRVLDFGVNDFGSPYMTMELFDGLTLADYLEGSFLGQEDLLDVFIQAASAIAYSHEHGILHRDIKPSNIIVISDANQLTIKVIDFGISKIMNGLIETGMTSSNRLIGSPLYMSPEQIRNRGVNESSDIYSLGCVLYESVSGNVPFRTESTVELLQKHLYETPQSLTKDLSRKNLPLELDRIILRCLEKEPSKRYDSMSALLLDLESVRESEAANEKSQLPNGNVGRVSLYPAPKASRSKIHLWIGSLCLVIMAVVVLGRLDLARSSSGEVSKEGLVIKDRADLEFAEYYTDGLFKKRLNKNLNATVVDSGKNFLVTDSSMTILQEMRKVRKLYLSYSAIGDETLGRTAHLPLECVHLSGTYVTDSGLKSLSNQRALKELRLAETGITSKGLEPLKSLRIEKLDISATRIDDTVGDALKKLALSELNISDTSASNILLMQLAEIKSLKRLKVNKCPNIDDSYLRSFNRKRPDCKVTD